MCVEIFRERMTVTEARRALRELVATTEDQEQLKHYHDLAQANDKELKEIAKDNQPE